MSSPNEEIVPPQIQTASAASATPRNRGWIVFWLAGAILLGASFFLDAAVIDWLRQHVSKLIRNLGGEISDYGDWPWLMLCAAPFLLYAWRAGRTTLLRWVAVAMIASTLAGLTANVIRLSTGRARPNAEYAVGWHGWRHDGKWIIGKNKFSSFPSGHTATAFGFFGVLALPPHRRTWLWLLPAFLIAASRLVVNAHHLSDVVLGAWIGLAFAAWLVRREAVF